MDAIRETPRRRKSMFVGRTLVTEGDFVRIGLAGVAPGPGFMGRVLTLNPENGLIIGRDLDGRQWAAVDFLISSISVGSKKN